MTPRPHRQGKGDRLIYPGASAAEIQCDHALAPFDRMALEMDRKWGIDRLPALVSPETAAKYGSAIAKLNAAINASDPDDTAARAGVCIRGMHAMDREASAAGHQPMPPTIWEIEIGGRICGIIQDNADWPVVAAHRPGLTTYTLREVAIALDHNKNALAVKDQIPGAQITAIRQPSPIAVELDDDIPF